MVLPKTFLTRRGALMLFVAAPEKVLPSLTAEEAAFIRQRFFQQSGSDFTHIGRSVNSIKDLYKMILEFGESVSSKNYVRKMRYLY